MYYYQVFGLAIRSELKIPELVERDLGRSEVHILLAPSDPAAASNRISGTSQWVKKREAHLSYAGIGSFLIRAGGEILIDPAPGVEEGSLRLFLLGQVLGTLAFLQGSLVLHGSALSINGCGVAFLGHSGEGKSTLAAAFSDQYPLIADDVLVIQTSEAAPLICPAFPQLKLDLETAASLGFDLKKYAPASPLEEKITHRVPEGFQSSLFP